MYADPPLCPDPPHGGGQKLVVVSLKIPGGPAEESVRAQIAEMEAFLAENRK